MKTQLKRWMPIAAALVLMTSAATFASQHGGGHGGDKEGGCCETGGQGSGGSHGGHQGAKADRSDESSGAAAEAAHAGHGEQAQTRERKREGHGAHAKHGDAATTTTNVRGGGPVMGEGMSCCSGGGHGGGHGKSGMTMGGAGAADEPSEASAPQRMRRHGRHGTHGGPAGQAGSRRGVMHNAMSLVHNNDAIMRTVEEIPGGIRSVSTTSDASLLETLRNHPREMEAFYKAGGSVRHWDPLFVELSKHQDKITMEFKDIENGIEVTSTSSDPDVVKLIRAHASKVSEFVTRGRAAAHEATALPEGYSPDE